MNGCASNPRSARACALTPSRIGVLLAAMLVNAAAARAEFVDPTPWVTGGPASSLAISGNRLYVGGEFQYVGPNTGGFVAIDANTGALQPGWPRVDGDVLAMAPDGSGGWYLGGTFHRVAGVARDHVAHVRADGTLDAWNPGADTTVFRLAVRGSTVFASGAFTKIGGQFRFHLAALDTVTGLATSWNAAPDGPVGDIVLAGSILYVGGSFATIGGQTRHCIAALDVVTGQAQPWNPDGNYDVGQIVISGTTAYVCGGFTHLGGQPRRGLAALDLATGLATPWAADLGGVEVLAVAGSRVYVGGTFTTFGGLNRDHLAALDVNTGAVVTSWAPRPDSLVPFPDLKLINTIVPVGSQVFVGGIFDALSRAPRGNLAALDATTGLATSWDAPTNGAVANLRVVGSTVFVAGSFESAGGRSPGSIAAFDLASGAAVDWNPGAVGNVTAIARLGSGIAFGQSWWSGPFPAGLGAVDSVTGVPTSWSPTSGGATSALASNEDLVFAAGQLWSYPGHTHFAALSAADASLVPAFPDPDGAVRSLVWNGSTLLAGGDFTQFGTDARSRLAALDPATGLVSAWHPLVDDGSVHAVAVDGSTVYVGGTFSSLGGQPRAGIGAVDAASGQPTPWHPGDAGTQLSVDAVRANANRVYVGGTFTTMGGQPRRSLAALDASTGQATAWNPSPDGWVNAFEGAGDALYVGGGFHAMGGRAVRGVARVLPAPASPPQVSIVAPNGGETAGVGSVRTVSWNASAAAPGVESVDLWLSRDGGTWTLVAAGVPNSGSYAWHVEGIASAHCRLRIDARDYAGGVASDVTDGEFAIVTGNVGVDLPLAPDVVNFAPVRPDPAVNHALVEWSLARAASVRLTLHDLQGREVRLLAEGVEPPGRHTAGLDVGPFAPGLYFVRLESSGRVQSRRFVILH